MGLKQAKTGSYKVASCLNCLFKKSNMMSPECKYLYWFHDNCQKKGRTYLFPKCYPYYDFRWKIWIIRFNFPISYSLFGSFHVKWTKAEHDPSQIFMKLFQMKGIYEIRLSWKFQYKLVTHLKVVTRQIWYHKLKINKTRGFRQLACIFESQ